MQVRLLTTAVALLLASTTSGSQPAAPSGPNATLPAGPGPATEAAVLTDAERAATAAEAWELKGGSAFGDGELRAPELEKARAGVSAYLAAHPDDVRALLLKARVLRALIVVTPVAIKLEEQGGRVTSGDTTNLRSDALAALDRALAADPKNADAYYWKARSLMLSNPAAEQVGAEQAFDPAPAIAAARTAVSLAPANTAYREYLALALFGVGRTAEALQELGKLPGKHPILQLSDDLKVVPSPAGAEPDRERASEIISEIFAGHMDVFRYPGLRASVYRLASSPADVEAFYARIWPGIRWVKQGAGRPAMAGLAWRQDKLEPIADPAPFNGDFDKQLPPSGVLVVVSRDEESKPVRTLLFIVNFRRL